MFFNHIKRIEIPHVVVLRPKSFDNCRQRSYDDMIINPNPFYQHLSYSHLLETQVGGVLDGWCGEQIFPTTTREVPVLFAPVWSQYPTCPAGPKLKEELNHFPNHQFDAWGMDRHESRGQ